jgi:type II secretory ATPase GspE/PulE/Tfp pilus assembly ATPase PilB-like protein
MRIDEAKIRNLLGSLMKRSLWKKYNCIPIDEDESSMIIAFAEEPTPKTINALSFLFQKEIVAETLTTSEIQDFIDKYAVPDTIHRH